MATFTQNFHGPVGAVYNAETMTFYVGDKPVLTPQSTPADLGREIATQRAAIDATPELTPAVRTAATQALEAAEAESKSPAPKGESIKGHLETAAQALDGATGVVVKAAGLAKTLFALGAWAASVIL